MDIFLGVLFLIVCVLLIGVVLLQKGRGGGLSAAFGGAGSSAFGTRVGDVFTWVTIVLTALFLLLAIGATLAFRPAPGVVAKPYFKPSPLEHPDYDKPAFVAIECATGDAKIYYTLDGATPDENSQEYSNSRIRVESGQTLKAIAYRAGGWTPSEVAAAYYGPPEEEISPEAVPTTSPVKTLPATTDVLPPEGDASPAETDAE